MTLVEQLRGWEANMTRDELNAAMAFVESHGWRRGSEVPPYVWAEAYRTVAPDKMPKPPTQH